MLTLYTAIGYLKFKKGNNKQPLPVILPVKDTFSIRFFSCIYLCLEGKIKIGDFSRYLRKETYSPIEEVILKLAEKVPLSTAEILTSIEKKANIQCKTDVMKELYEDSDATCQSLAEDAQIYHPQFPALQAIGNLYLNKQISFQIF